MINREVGINSFKIKGKSTIKKMTNDQIPMTKQYNEIPNPNFNQPPRFQFLIKPPPPKLILHPLKSDN